MRTLCYSLFFVLLSLAGFSQPVPTIEENIPFLVTFGSESSKKWGDDDMCQIFFFVIPENVKSQPIYLRVFDPDNSGKYDEQKGEFDSKTTFSVYGGNGCYSNEYARGVNPVGDFQSGNLLASKTFGVSEKYDDNWYTFGPFNPTEGEYIEKFKGYVFKLIAQGVSGDDGNLYRYFLSSDPNDNKPVEGGNSFTFEYSFRLHDDPRNISHIYPRTDDKVVSIKISNFDWDFDGNIQIVSVVRNKEKSEVSGDGNWVHTVHPIAEEEKNATLDIQFQKRQNNPIKNNNVVLYITNQYGEMLPFFTTPIGGIPKYKYSIEVKKVK